MRSLSRKLRLGLLVGAVASVLAASGCSSDSDDDTSVDNSETGGNPALQVDENLLASTSEVQQLVAEKGQFNDGFMPTGSTAQDNYLEAMSPLSVDTPVRGRP